MHTPVARAVGIELKAGFQYRTKLREERGHYILFAEAVRNQIEIRVLRDLALLGRDKSSRSTEHRLCMADEALVGVMPGA